MIMQDYLCNITKGGSKWVKISLSVWLVAV